MQDNRILLKEELFKNVDSDVLPEESLEDGLALFRKMVKPAHQKTN